MFYLLQILEDLSEGEQIRMVDFLADNDQVSTEAFLKHLAAVAELIIEMTDAQESQLQQELYCVDIEQLADTLGIELPELEEEELEELLEEEGDNYGF